MGKKLSEMTLEELWQLFPIFLTEHHACWADWYQQEAAALQACVPQAVRISHIGSTAIEGIWAKPIIDILLEMPQSCDLAGLQALLAKQGYICMSRSEGRLSFNKGYTENGFAEKVFHLHVRHAGDHDELYFRDYLREEPATAKAYEQLKLSLWKEYEHDRDGYTNAKADLVRQMTAAAREKYGKRY